ncbi:hypothetical protein AOQ84DRAFT_431649 [Glonium stellatum]|uniref:Uncharacterized protein n=1 Tax=Glonium stellatum TaxID=574774 RepID=A0A8E2F175_9PEZI|nr:hypothetical protein AOQ84DRAFT_431649 [Glonium stellatum]
MAPVAISKTDGASNKAPSPLQIALALAVGRSKPDDVSFKDFILRLRNHLRPGRQPDAEKREHQHLNSATYWQDQYEQSEASRLELLAQVTRIERERDLLKGKSSAADTSKRRRDFESDSMASKPAKRARPNKRLTADSALLPPHGSFSENFDPLEAVGKDGATLIQSLYTIHKLLKHRKLNPDSLCYSLVQASRAISSVITTYYKRRQLHSSTTASSAKQKHPSSVNSQARDSAESASIIQASARAFASLLLGLSRFSNEGDQGHQSGLVIYECVSMFRAILNSITELALESAKQNMALAMELKPEVASKSRGKMPKPVKDENVARSVSQLLNAILSYLDPKDSLHRTLFEGFMFVLLDRVGERLFVCIFDRERSATIEGDISPPEHLGAPAAGPGKELETKAAHLELPTLISTLERAMALAPQHLSAHLTPMNKTVKPPTSTVNSGKSSATNKSSSSSGKITLSHHAKDRLQQTLVNCMFGVDNQDDFADCIKMPTRVGPLPPPPKVEEQDTAEWFKQEVWRLVGWEILRREGDW